MKFDLSKFKKVASSKTHTIMQHPDGHTIHIAHASVDSATKKDLKGLPEHFADGGAAQGLQAGMTEGAFPEAPEQSLPENMQMNTPTNVDQPSDIQAPNFAPAVENHPISQASASQQNPLGQIYGEEAAQEQKGVANQIAGANQVYKAESQKAKQEAAVQKTRAGELQTMADAYQQSAQDIDTESANFQNDIANQHINPHAYIDNMKTGQKIRTGIGLILGGIGAGMAGNDRNMALEFLNHNIDRDIEGQKMEMGRRKSLFEANMQRFKNVQSATEMTKAMTGDVVVAQMAQIAAQTNDPMAKARLLSVVGQIQQQNAATLARTKMRSAIMQGASSGAIPLSQAVNAMATDPKQRDEALKEVGIAEKTAAAHAAVDRIIPAIMQQQTLANRTLNPVQSRQIIESLQSQLVPLMIDIAPSKRLTPETLKAEIAPNIPGFTTGKTTAQELAAGIHNSIETLKDHTPVLEGMGLKVPQYQIKKHAQAPSNYKK